MRRQLQLPWSGIEEKAPPEPPAAPRTGPRQKTWTCEGCQTKATTEGRFPPGWHTGHLTQDCYRERALFLCPECLQRPQVGVLPGCSRRSALVA